MLQALAPGIVVALLVMVAILIGSYWLVKRHEGAPRRSRERKPDPRPAIDRTGGRANRRASDVLADAKRLHASRAGWSDILATLNPSDDRAMAGELQAIRGPHMFAPELALQVIEHGCAEALRKDPNASAHAGLLAAREGMEKVTRYGD